MKEYKELKKLYRIKKGAPPVALTEEEYKKLSDTPKKVKTKKKEEDE